MILRARAPRWMRWTPAPAEARTEWRQKVAWAYYINNQDNDAFLMAASIGDGSAPMAGPWLAEAPGWRALPPGAWAIA
jgi:hypothetical protein